MPSKIFVNLPVTDLKRSMGYFRELGYTFNPQFSNDDGACMVISEDIYAMLLTQKFFQTFTTKKIVNAKESTEVLIALSFDSRAAVDQIAEKALANGGKPAGEPKDYGFMYQRSIEDLDGHVWEYFWMDPANAQQQ